MTLHILVVDDSGQQHYRNTQIEGVAGNMDKLLKVGYIETEMLMSALSAKH